MKNETKKKIAAVSAVSALAALIGNILLGLIEHHAQWVFGGACVAGMVMAFVFMTSIDC